MWEFISSQRVCDLVVTFSSPLEACRAILAESYRLWLQFDVRTDDITMILAWLDSDTAGPAPRPASADEKRKYELLLEAGHLLRLGRHLLLQLTQPVGRARVLLTVLCVPPMAMPRWRALSRPWAPQPTGSPHMLFDFISFASLLSHLLSIRHKT